MSSDRTDRRNDSAERMKADRQSVVTLFLFPRGTFPSKEIGLLRRTVTGSSHPSPSGRRCGEPADGSDFKSLTEKYQGKLDRSRSVPVRPIIFFPLMAIRPQILIL